MREQVTTTRFYCDAKFCDGFADGTIELVRMHGWWGDGQAHLCPNHAKLADASFAELEFRPAHWSLAPVSLLQTLCADFKLEIDEDVSEWERWTLPVRALLTARLVVLNGKPGLVNIRRRQ